MKKNLLFLVFVLFMMNSFEGIGQQHALDFARNSCVDIPEITELTGTAARSVEAWIMVPSNNESWWQPVIIEWGVNTSGKKWDFRLDEHRLRVEHAGGYAVATTALNDSMWHHVVVTAEANSLITEVKFYIDGVEDPISSSSGPLIETASGPFSIGRAVADDQDVRYWIGKIDEVRLWKKALSLEEINTIKDSEVCVDDHPDLVAYYKFNDGEGTTVTDETGNYDGVLGSGKTDDGLPTWIEGYDITLKNCDETIVQGSALDFARNSCVDIPEITELTGTAARSVEAWIMVPSNNENWWQPVIIEWGVNTSGKKWDFRLDEHRLRVEHAGGYAVATTTLNDSMWHHVVVTAEANSLITEVKFYIDGVEDPISASSGPLIETAPGPISIGRAVADDQDVRYWIGKIDEVRLWKKALSLEEINTIKDSEVCTEDHSDLVAYYKFNENEGTTVADETGNYDGVLGSGKTDDGLPAWSEGVSVVEAICVPTSTIKTELTNSFRIYPNPAGNQIRIDTDINVEKIVIYDLTGRQIKTLWFDNKWIDISSLKSGLYFLHGKTEKNQYVFSTKFVKQ